MPATSCATPSAPCWWSAAERGPPPFGTCLRQARARQGGIYHEVLEEAKSIGADLIVMSSHRPAMKTYFLGSNAGHVVRYAKCSVLVVRP